MQMPLVSVIIPAYNRAHYLAQAVQSVLSQTYDNLELIVVDDGSTDDMLEVLASFTDPRLRVIRQANAGPSAARNNGIRHATGEWLMFLDSDDVMLPHNLEWLAAALASRSAAGVAYGWFYYMDVAGAPLALEHGDLPAVLPVQRERPWNEATPRPCGTYLEGEIASDFLLAVDGTVAMGCALVRREWVEKIGGFDPAQKGMEHWDFYLRLALAGCRYACIQQAVLIVREHDSGIHQNVKSMLASRLSILDAIFASPELPESLHAIKSRAYLNTHLQHAGHYLNHDAAPEALDCICNACRFGQPDMASLTPVVHALTAYTLKRDVDDGRRALQEFVVALPAGAIRRQIEAPVSHQIDLRAFSESRTGNSRITTLKLGARCGLYQPALVLNKWWLRTMLEAGLGRKV